MNEQIPTKIRIDQILKSQVVDSDKLIYFNGRGEANIYKLDNLSNIDPEIKKYLLKIYYDKNLTENRQKKVLHLCSLYDTFNGIFDTGQYALPKYIATNAINNNTIGFMMENLGICPHVGELGYVFGKGYTNRYGVRNDEDAVELIYSMAEGLEKLHKSNIVLGDLNPSNILYNPSTKKPMFIDIDSAQIGNFTCEAYTKEYLDPFVINQSRNLDNSYKYNASSDIFSLAVISYQLLIGSHPCFFRSRPRPDISDELLPQKVFFIKLIENPEFLCRQSFEIMTNTNLSERLAEIKQKYAKLYQYFFEIFVNDKRESLLYTLPITDERHPQYKFYNPRISNNTLDESSIKTPTEPVIITPEDEETIRNVARRPVKIRKARNTNDSDEFKLFVKYLGIDYAELITEGISQ